LTLLRRLGAALRSLRWRLTLTYLVMIALLLAALGGFQYVTLRGTLISNRVSELKFDLDAAAKLYAARGAALTGRQKLTLLTTLVGQSSGAAAAVAVYGPTGTRLLVRPADSDPPQLDQASFAAVLSGGGERSQVVPGAKGDDLVVGFPVGTVDPALRRTAGVLEVSEPMAPIDTVLDSDIGKLAIGGGAVLILVLVLGLLVTTRALRPLRRLTATAGELASGDLRARSRLVPRDDEVGRLATAFDHMADRIEIAFAAQLESEARVRRFIADASHELRTPVTALSGYIEVLRRGAADSPAALDAALGAMAREADRLRLLVLDLLTLARLDARARQRPEAVDLGEAVARLLDEGLPGLPPDIVRDLPATPVVAWCDRSALGTVLRNLLVNACKYAPGARQVWSVRRDGGRARVDVHDEGPGIPQTDLPHIFERFYRGEKTRSREEGGSGLGLAIVKGLVEAQGGEVAVASAEGAGTTVTVWLPLAQMGTPAPPGPATAPPPAPATGPASTWERGDSAPPECAFTLGRGGRATEPPGCGRRDWSGGRCSAKRSVGPPLSPQPAPTQG
jgi:two-component system OmpR family sensor kinase